MESCYLHASRAATTKCDLCRRAICGRCAAPTAAGALTCPACVEDAQRTGRRRRFARRVLGTAAAGAVAVGLWYFGQFALSQRWHQPDAVAKLVHRGDEAAAQDAYETADNAYLRALAIAPDDPVVHARLGFLRYAQGRDSEARRHLEQAHLNGSQDPAVASTLDQMVEDERARQDSLAHAEQRARLAEAETERVWAEAAAAEAEARRQRARAMIASAAAAQEDAVARKEEAEERQVLARERVAAEGRCAIPLQAGPSGAAMIAMVVDGADATFILDTGATRTSVTEELSNRLQLPIDPDRVASVKTANGTAEMAISQLGEIALGNRAVHDVPIIVCSQCALSGADGLLGLDVQSALNLEIDVPARVVRMRGCED